MKRLTLSRASTLAIASVVSIATAAPALAQTSSVPRSTQVSSDGQGARSPEVAESASSPSTVEEIVVTAQFREQNLQKTPIAITAVSGEMLQARSQTNIAEVANQAPNVTLRPGNANFGPSLAASIRGIGQYDFDPAVEPGVGLYVDDVYYATLTGSIFDLLDLDRVEVLRGPQGTLAGRNSIGGAIKLYSKRPIGDDSGTISATYGSRNRMDLRASGDFNLAKDLDVRVSGVAKRQQGYVKDLDFGCVNPPGSANNPAAGGVGPLRPGGTDCRLGRMGGVNYQAVRGQLRYHPGDVLDINIIGDYTDEDRNPTASVLTYANNANPAVQAAIRGDAPAVAYDSRFLCGDYCNYANFIMPANPALGLFSTTREPTSKFKGWGVSGQADLNLSDTLKLTSITAYRRYSSVFTGDDDLSPLPLTSSRSDVDFHFFSQELRLNGSIGDALEYTLGGYYSSQKSDYATVQDLRWVPLQFASLGDPVPAHSRAGFLHLSWRATDKLTLIGGLRYTDEDKKYTYSRRNADGSLALLPTDPAFLVGALDGVSGKYSHHRFDYRANVQYQWSPELMTYAQFSTGFKGGGINPRPYFASQVQPFGPETIEAYEVGLKSDLFDRLARVNISAFYNNYKDIQLTLLSCPQYNPPFFPPGVPGLPCALPANAGDAHVKGVELETSIRPVPGFLIDGSVSYLDFKYTSIDPNAGGPTNPAGVQLGYLPPFASKWKWSVGAQYSIELGEAGSLTPRIDAAYQSKIFTNAVNGATNLVPGYAVANARLTWQNPHKDLEISAEVTNLFDKYYLLNVFDLSGTAALNGAGASSTGAGYAVGQPGRPREWALTVIKRF